MVQPQTHERQERDDSKVVTRSVTLYPDEWHEIIEDAWQQRISVSENVRRIIRLHYQMDNSPLATSATA